MMENLLSIKQVAAILGVSVGTVRNYIKGKLLKASQMRSNKKGRNEYRIRPADLKEILKNYQK